jgi:hypothetical protein
VGLVLAKKLLIKFSLVDIASGHLAITGDPDECSASIQKGFHEHNLPIDAASQSEYYIHNYRFLRNSYEAFIN